MNSRLRVGANPGVAKQHGANVAFGTELPAGTQRRALDVDWAADAALTGGARRLGRVGTREGRARASRLSVVRDDRRSGSRNPSPKKPSAGYARFVLLLALLGAAVVAGVVRREAWCARSSKWGRDESAAQALIAMRLPRADGSMKLLRYAALLLCWACARSESAREDQAMKAAIPQRLQPDGTIKLSDSDRTVLDLAVARAVEGELPEVVVRFGRVRPALDDESLVVSPVAGRIARAPAVRLGTSVKAAAALLDVVPVLSASDRISVSVRGAELRGQIASARRELATQQAALDRARALASSNIVSEAKLQEAETSVATTRARLDALQRAASLQTTGEGTPITLRAPSSGTVATLNASVGAIVQQGDLLVRILKLGPRWVDVSVAPSEPAGHRYEVAVGAASLPARLIAVGAVAEADGSRHDRLQIDDDPAAGRLVPGQTVTVRVARGVAQGIVVPEAAIVPGVQTDLVFVETTAGTYAPRPVRVAARFSGQVRLASGIRAGENVVIRGAMSLQGESRRRELAHGE